MGQSLVPDHQSPEVAQPGEGAFHLPTVPVIGDVGLPARPGPLASPLRDAGLDPSAAQPEPERTAVVSPVRHQFLGTAAGPVSTPGYFDGGQCRLCQVYFRLLGAGHQSADGHSLAIRHANPQRFAGGRRRHQPGDLEQFRAKRVRFATRKLRQINEIEHDP